MVPPKHLLVHGCGDDADPGTGRRDPRAARRREWPDRLRDGALVRAFEPPVHAGTYGAQHFWYARPIVTGGRVVAGAADGTITVFSVAVDQPRPRPMSLVADTSLGLPTPSSIPASGPALPAPAKPPTRPGVLAVLIGAIAVVLTVATVLRVRHRHV